MPYFSRKSTAETLRANHPVCATFGVSPEYPNEIRRSAQLTRSIADSVASTSPSRASDSGKDPSETLAAAA
jgi:hypothetical protein